MPNPVLEATRTLRDAKQAELDEVLKAPTAEARVLNADEKLKFVGLEAEIVDLDKQARAFEESDARVAAAAAAAAEQERESLGAAQVISEPMTYDRDGRNSYLFDLATLAAAHLDASYAARAPQANERLTQHRREIDVEAKRDVKVANMLHEMRAAVPNEQRVQPNTTAGTGGEFVPPLWLIGQYIPILRASRVVVNRIPTSPLPTGIGTINLPRIKVGTQTGVQAAQGGPVASRDITTDSISCSIITIAGQEDLAMQLLEQSPISMDQVIYDDLTADYDYQTSQQVLVGSGSNGQHKGVFNLSNQTNNTDVRKASAVTCASVVFADASTSGTQFRSVVNGKNQVETIRLMPATAIWANPRRVNSWEYATDTAGRPLFTAYTAFNNLGQETPNVPQGYAGAVSGLPVFKDANIPTTCVTGAVTGGTGDIIGVVKEDDLRFWEGSLHLRALPEILSGTLQVRFQVYAYQAFMPDRFPASVSMITGTTGLAAPAF